jgi:acylglycerol lipase
MSCEIPLPPFATAFSLRSPRGARLATRVWPCTSPKALLLFVHGSGWHSGYFRDLAACLNPHGIFCCGYDQPSHGYSEAEPAAPKGCIHIADFDDCAEDVAEATYWARKECNDNEIPLFLFGESFGGLIVLQTAMNAMLYGIHRLRGVIVSAPALKIVPELLPPAIVIRIVTWLAPYYPRLQVPATDLGASYDDAFGDKRWAAASRNDAKVQTAPSYTLSSAAATLSTGQQLMDSAAAHKFHVPLLAIHAKRDCRTQCAATEEFVDRVNQQQQASSSSLLAEGFFLDDTSGHQLLQDLPKVTNMVKEKVVLWIQEQLKK